MRNIVLGFAAGILFTLPARPQLVVDWQRNYGGSSGESAHCIKPTTDGGYIVLGRTLSSDGQVSGHHGLDDLWVLKLDALGNVQWQRCLGGSLMEIAGDVLQTADGGYYILGTAVSEDGDPPPTLGSSDIWLLKLNALGDVQWQRRYGGTSFDEGRSLLSLSDGTFLIVGYTMSPVFPNYHHLNDLLVIHINADGSEIDSRCFGGSDSDMIGTVTQAEGDQITISGHVSSNDGDVLCEPTSPDVWSVRIGADLAIQWSTCIGGGNLENARVVQTTATGNVYLAMNSSSSDGDVSSNNGEADYWLAKLSADGTLVAEEAYGGSGDDFPRSLIRRTDGTVYVCGISYSTDGDITQPLGSTDLWLLKVNDELDLIWQMSIGGSSGDYGQSMCFAPDGGLVVAGVTASTDGGIPTLFGGPDLWVVKFQPENVGVDELEHTNGMTLQPNPADNDLTVQWNDLDAEVLEVVDATGRCCYRTTTPLTMQGTMHLNTAELSSGLYVLRLVGKDELKSQRFIKR